MSYMKFLALSIIIIGLIECSAQRESRFIDLDGKKQHVRVKGVGKPTVVFVTGLAEPLRNYDSIQNELSKITTTFSYDRAGLGQSEPILVERSIDHMAQELNRILEIEKLEEPYLLVGHSLGGLIIRYYNYLYPDKVSGLFFIDPSSEKYDDELRRGLSQQEVKKLDSLDFVLFPWTRDERVPLAIRSEYQNYKTKNKELIKHVRFPINKPITIISSARYSDIEKEEGVTQREIDIWVDLHRSWIKEAPQIRHIITEKGGHYIHNNDPELVISELKLLLDKIKRN
jgi:pimeloyl-ACP methyl ester carboxylesterase